MLSYIVSTKKEFEGYKRQIIDIVEYCLFNKREELKDLKLLEKLHIFIHSNSIDKYPIYFSKVIKLNKSTSRMNENELIETLKDRDNNRYGIQEIHEIEYNLFKLHR